eukprot:scaffold51788_cov59-Phaeocystis_antarctica.AAC.3
MHPGPRPALCGPPPLGRTGPSSAMPAQGRHGRMPSAPALWGASAFVVASRWVAAIPFGRCRRQLLGVAGAGFRVIQSCPLPAALRSS